MEQTQTIQESKIRVKVLIAAKGNKYGEYSFRGDTEKELEENGQIAKTQFEEHTKEDYE